MANFFKLAAMKSRFNCPMTRIQTAGYVAYCTVTCNGSTDISEIIRRLSEHYGIHNRDKETDESDVPDCDIFCLLSDYDKGEDRGNLYSSLFEISNTRMPKAAGSCRQPRHTLSSMGEPFIVRDEYLTEYCKVKKLLGILQECSTVFHSKKPLTAAFVQKRIHNDLQPKLLSLDGIGPFNVHHVIHLSALLGLLPLKAMTFASLSPTPSASSSSKKKTNCDNRGPVKLIRRTCFELVNGKRVSSTIPIATVQEIFEKVFSEIGSIMESTYFDRMSFENVLCELNRILEYFLKKERKKGKKSNVSQTMYCQSMFCT